MSRNVIGTQIGRCHPAAWRAVLLWLSERSQTLTGGMTASRRGEHLAEVRALEKSVTVELESLARASNNILHTPRRTEGRSFVNPWEVGHGLATQVRWRHNEVGSRQVVG